MAAAWVTEPLARMPGWPETVLQETPRALAQAVGTTVDVAEYTAAQAAVQSDENGAPSMSRQQCSNGLPAPDYRNPEHFRFAADAVRPWSDEKAQWLMKLADTVERHRHLEAKENLRSLIDKYPELRKEL